MDNQMVSAPAGDRAQIGWNWGAFVMPVQFGIGNKAYLCLLALVPFLSLIWCFVSGFKGAEWAYSGGDFDSVKEFNASMRTWNRAGVVMAIIAGVFIALYIALFAGLLGIFSSLANYAPN